MGKYINGLAYGSKITSKKPLTRTMRARSLGSCAAVVSAHVPKYVQTEPIIDYGGPDLNRTDTQPSSRSLLVQRQYIYRRKRTDEKKRLYLDKLFSNIFFLCKELEENDEVKYLIHRDTIIFLNLLGMPDDPESVTNFLDTHVYAYINNPGLENPLQSAKKVAAGFIPIITVLAFFKTQNMSTEALLGVISGFIGQISSVMPSHENLTSELQNLFGVSSLDSVTFKTILKSIYEGLTGTCINFVKSVNFKYFCTLLAYLIVKPEEILTGKSYSGKIYGFVADFIHNNCLSTKDLNIDFFILTCAQFIKFIDKGYNWFLYGSFKTPLTNEYNIFMDEVGWLKTNFFNITYSITADEGKVSASEYDMRLTTAFVNVNNFLSVAVDTEKCPIPRTELLRYKASLEDLQERMMAAQVSMNSRSTPMSVLFYGVPGVGKTDVQKLVMNAFHCAMHPNIPYQVGMEYTRSPGDDYWSGYYGQKYIVFDDVGSVRENFDRSPNELIQVVNEQPFVPNMADLPSKGKIACAPELVCVTTNFKDLRAGHKYNCKEAILRRFEVVVTVTVKPQYANASGGIDTRLIPTGEFDEPIQDFLVQRFVPQDNNTYVYEDLLETDSRQELTKWFAKYTKNFKLKSLNNKYRTQRSMAPMCEHGVYLSAIEGCKECNLDEKIQVTNPLQSNVTSTEAMIHAKIGMWVFVYFINAVFGGFLEFFTLIFSTTFLYYAPWFFIGYLTDTFYSILFSVRSLFVLYHTFKTYNTLLKQYHFTPFSSFSTWRTKFRQFKDRVYIEYIKIYGKYYHIIEHVSNNSEIYKALGITISLAVTAYSVSKLYNSSGPKVLQSETIEQEEVKSQDKGFWNKQANLSIPKNPVTASFHEDDVQKTLRLHGVTISYSHDDIYEYSSGFLIGKGLLVTARHNIFQGGFFINTISIHRPGFKSFTLSLSKENVCTSQDTDVAIILCQRINSVKNIFKYFRDYDFEGVVNLKTICPPRPRELCSERIDGAVVSYNSVPHQGYTGRDWKIFPGRQGRPLFGNQTIGGDSGSPVMSNDPNGFSIYGVHVAYQKEHCCSVPVTRKQIDDAVIYFTSRGKILFDHNPLQINLCEINPKRDYFMQNDDRFGASLGAISEYSVSSPSKSKIEKTFWFEYCQSHIGVTEFDAPTVKSLKGGLNENNEWVDPYSINLIGRLKHNRPFKDKVLTRCKESYLAKFKDVNFKYKVLSLHESLNGIDGEDYIDSINKSTSSGYPLYGPKLDYLDPHPVLENKHILKTEILIQYKEMHDKLKSGHPISTIFTAHLKDEPRSKEKIAKHKIRVFSSTNFIFTILMRQYLLKFCQFLHINRYKSEMAVGINAEDPSEWEELYNYISCYKNFINGDYGSFDTTMDPCIKVACSEILVNLCTKAGASEDETKIIVLLLEPIVYPIFNVKGQLMQLYNSNVSGQTMTVQFNGIANSLYHRYSYYESGLSNFNDNVNLMTYGDDAIAGVKNEFSQISHRDHMAKHGVKYTNADKTPVVDEYCKEDKMDFLKRSFIKDETGKYLAPLDLTSLTRSMSLYHKSTEVTPLEHHTIILENYIRAAARHGDEEYEAARDHAKVIANKYLSGIPINIPENRATILIDPTIQLRTGGLPLGNQISGSNLTLTESRVLEKGGE